MDTCGLDLGNGLACTKPADHGELHRFDPFNRDSATGVQRALLTAADELRQFASERFAAHGPYDARGAALWDAAAHITEKIARRYTAQQR